MHCPTAPSVLTMILVFVAFSMLGILFITPGPCAGDEAPCPDGRLCPAHWLCCEQGCCAPPSPPPGAQPAFVPREMPYPWYAQWPVLFLLGTMGGIVVCCIWCLCVKRETWRERRYRDRGPYLSMYSLSCCTRRRPSEHGSAGSVYPPPRYSRCSSFYQAPPPYSEVTSKPDLYPLVITCGDAEGKGGGNYLMVHYFRNYVIRPPGSLSAASTAESLNSSFICNAANEANSFVPPPYSCSNNYDDWYGRSMLRSVSSLNERVAPPPPPRSRTAPAPSPPRRQRNIPPISPELSYEMTPLVMHNYKYGYGYVRPMAAEEAYEREAQRLRCMYSGTRPDLAHSPPHPTNHTELRDPTQQQWTNDQRRRRSEQKWPVNGNARRSQYMQLPIGNAKIIPCERQVRVSSRSAPATPCEAQANLINFNRAPPPRHASLAEEEKDPLLKEQDSDKKF